MTGAMEVRFEPTAEDHRALARYWTRHQNRSLGENRGVAVPRRALASAEDYKAALDMLRRHLPDEKIGVLEHG